MFNEESILCASNAYEEKFFFNPAYSTLPEAIKEELKIMCVLTTSEVGGILIVGFEQDGTLYVSTTAAEDDLLYDEIGSALKVKQLRSLRRELFENLEMYYKTFVLGQPYMEE